MNKPVPSVSALIKREEDAREKNRMAHEETVQRFANELIDALEKWSGINEPREVFYSERLTPGSVISSHRLWEDLKRIFHEYSVNVNLYPNGVIRFTVWWN